MKKIKTFIIYFPILLVALQVLVNIFGIICPEVYIKAGFYLNTFLGTNILFAIFLLAFTFSFNFCAVSRFSAIAELLFAVNFLIVKEDNLYNIIFQITSGSIALLLTYNYFIRQYPLCRISLVHKFFSYCILAGGCKKGLIIFEKEIESTVKLNSHAGYTRTN